MDEALELDELDKLRINNNIESLKEDNIPYLEYMVEIPINSLTTIKSKDEIVNKLLVDFLISSAAIYMISNNTTAIGKILNTVNSKYNTESILSIEDKTLIINIINRLYTPQELEAFSVRIESANVCLWTLGLVKRIDSFNKCNYDDIKKIILKYKNYDDLMKSAKMKSKEEILTKADLLTRYYWALREFKEETDVLSRLNKTIVDVQNETLEFITSYSYDSLNNKKIKLECNKGDLRFEFMVPTNLQFEKLSDDSRELIGIRNEDKTTRLVIQDLGRINPDEFQSKVDRNINLFVKSGFNILGRYSMHPTELERIVIRIVARRGSTSFNSYFIYVSNHLLRIDSLIESYIDSNNNYEILKARNTDIDFDIVFSIKEVK